MAALKDIRNVALRCKTTLLADMIGAGALCVMFIATLHLPQIL